ncbi:DUF397 domain-containing protein [Streptomyces sp. NPDC050161]|uniref:DUF397 domain-containing protein n=1 Tax=Streptomyces sp. NPDC050161 TaxID=3365604 RepID=UPI00379626A3
MQHEPIGVFRKSSYSNQEGNCVEVAHTTASGRAVRDSKDPGGPYVLFGARAWGSFVETLKSDNGAAL